MRLAIAAFSIFSLSVSGEEIPRPLLIMDGRDLYSWPGAKPLDERSLAERVNSGFISDGGFAVMAAAGRERRGWREGLVRG